ncbi:hypothetical protein FQA39_LY07094 [Lamprigera yunnana]|nr:hypothetical protein FQA39_LY07094 [Lamprigera yunnana]
MMFVLFVITLVFDLGNFDLIAPTKQDNSVRQCIKHIINVYSDDSTTVLSIYGDFTRGNFLPHPMQIPMINIDANKKIYNLHYEPRRELVIIDPINNNFVDIKILGFWDANDFSKRKFVFLVNAISSHVKNILLSLWTKDIIDVIFLVSDHKFRSGFIEVFVGNRYHPLNRCGSVVVGMSRFSCDTAKKNQKQKFFRNYRIDNIEGLVKEMKRKIYFIRDETLTSGELKTFSTRLGSYFIQDVNKVINSLRESGLIDYQDIIHKRMQKDYNQYYEQTQDLTENIVLGMKHVYPIFLFWAADYDSLQLKEMFNCEQHFSEESFINSSHHRLNNSAIPSKIKLTASKMLKRKHEEIKVQKATNEPNKQHSIKKGLVKHLSPAESPLNLVIPTRTYSSKESVCRMLQFSPKSSQSVNKTPCSPNEPVQVIDFKSPLKIVKSPQ